MLFIPLLVLIAGIGMAALWILPAIGRARFETRISSLRDETMDSVIAGELELTEDVEFLVYYLESLMERSSELTLGSALALYRALKKNGLLEDELSSDPTHADSPPAQQKSMLQVENRASRALADHLIEGSCLVVVLVPMRWLYRALLVPAIRRAAERQEVARREAEQRKREEELRRVTDSADRSSRRMYVPPSGGEGRHREQDPDRLSLRSLPTPGELATVDRRHEQANHDLQLA